MSELVRRWRSGYDWRHWEATLNAHSQVMVDIDGVDVHALHVRSPEPDALPLVLTHGWPTTVAEFLDVVGPLTDPAAHGADPRTAFHVVIPSIPGFGFSTAPADGAWDVHRVASAWSALMGRLGYERYGAHGNDVGATVSLGLGRVDPTRVVGVHVTQVFSLPSADPAELAALDATDLARVRAAEAFVRDRGAYLRLHATQPQTLAHALADSPAGLLAWSAQLFGPGVHPDHLLTHVTIQWLTNTAGTAAATGYRTSQRTDGATSSAAPIGWSTFAGDVFPSVRRLAERDHPTIVSWVDHPSGGHHPAHEVPDLLVRDIRAFFARSR